MARLRIHPNRRGERQAVFVVLAALAVAPAGASAATVQVSVSGNDSTCTPACRSVEKAVQVAGPGDVVEVGPGDFPVSATAITGVYITKRLDLRGAQFGVDARKRDPNSRAGESVLHPAGNTPYQGLLYVEEGAGGTSIRGFRIEGTTSAANAGGAAIYTEQRGSDGGYTISENIITGNTIGILLSSSGAATLVSHNLIRANTINTGAAAGGNGLYSERAHNVQIVENRFEDNEQTGVLTAVGAENRGTGNVFRRNQSVNETGGAVFVNQAGLTVAQNTFTGGQRTAIALGGDGLRDAQVVDNTITGKTGVRPNGIRLLNFGAEPNRDVTIVGNTITGSRSDDPAHGNAIWIGPDGADGSVRIARNRLVNNSGAGLRNDSPAARVDARNNWWGCNAGPAAEGCDDVTNPDDGSSPAFTPWLTLSLRANVGAAAHARAAQIPNGGTASLLARLSNLSTGGLAEGPFFGTATATFASTPAGAFDPATAQLPASDLTASSAFTADASPDELRVTVDNQTVKILNYEPPQPDVLPDVEPDDDTLTPAQRVAVVIALVNRGNGTARSVEACLRVSGKLQLSGKRCRRAATLPPGHTLVHRVIARARGDACRGRVSYDVAVRVAGRHPRAARAVGRLLAGPCRPRPCGTAARAVPASWSIGTPGAAIVPARISRIHLAC